LNNIGPKKIKSELLKLGFNNEEIEEGLNVIEDEELDFKLEKMIDKKISQIKNYSGNILKQKIIIYFTEKGFDKSNIEKILSNKDLNNRDLLLKEYDKLYNKYSKKYSGIELENIIKQKLYQKGFFYNDI
jgi:regulatory protein